MQSLILMFLLIYHIAFLFTWQKLSDFNCKTITAIQGWIFSSRIKNEKKKWDFNLVVWWFWTINFLWCLIATTKRQKLLMKWKKRKSPSRRWTSQGALMTHGGWGRFEGWDLKICHFFLIFHILVLYITTMNSE